MSQQRPFDSPPGRTNSYAMRKRCVPRQTASASSSSGTHIYAKVMTP